MVEKKCKFSYNELDDSLIISCKEENENVKERYSLGDFIFSLTGRGKIVGIQILNTSKVFSDYNIAPEFINNLEEIKMNVFTKDNCLCIELLISVKGKEAKIPVPLMNLTPQ